MVVGGDSSLTRTRLKALIEGGALTRNGEVFNDPSWKIRGWRAVFVNAAAR